MESSKLTLESINSQLNRGYPIIVSSIASKPWLSENDINWYPVIISNQSASRTALFAKKYSDLAKDGWNNMLLEADETLVLQYSG
jgi:hypothetical protein